MLECQAATACGEATKLREFPCRARSFPPLLAFRAHRTAEEERSLPRSGSHKQSVRSRLRIYLSLGTLRTLCAPREPYTLYSLHYLCCHLTSVVLRDRAFAYCRMARGLRKPFIASLRTRVLVFTLLLAMSESRALPPHLFRIPGVPQVDTIRVVWMVSFQTLAVVSSRRYLTATRRARHKCADWYQNVLLRSTNDQYRSYMRMHPSTFDHVLSLLRCHAVDVFASRLGTAQLALDVQLAIALYSFGHYGNSSRVDAVADLFGVSSGVVVKSTRRVIRGLNRLAPREIPWPNAERRAAEAEWAAETFCFENCIGATDGTTFPLAYQPALHPWSYYDRKGRYTLNAVVTCDWHGYITNIVQGCTGAAPDAFVQTLSNWHRFPHIYLSAGQCLLGDQGMKYSSWVIGPYLRPQLTTSDRRNFNYQLARLRVRSEHTIGVLKARFAERAAGAFERPERL